MTLFIVLLAIFLAVFLVGIPVTWLVLQLTRLLVPRFDRWYSDICGD